MTKIIGLIACNHGELGPQVYERALSLAPDQKARQKVWTRVRETMMKAIFPLGQARVLALELALMRVLRPEDTSDDEPLRNWTDDGHGTSQALDWLKKINPVFVDEFIAPIKTYCPDICEISR